MLYDETGWYLLFVNMLSYTNLVTYLENATLPSTI